MSKFDFNPFNDDSYSDDSDDIDDINENKHSSLPWIEKYRPKSLSDVASHKNIMDILKLFTINKSLPHLLLYGPPGTGKTSTMQAYARELYGTRYPFMVMEINASEDRGIDLVRNKIRQFVSSETYFQTLSDNKHRIDFKLVILDEVDAMTEDGQAILRHVIDNNAQNARFCLICNYIKKIDPTVVSRCISFRFSPIPDMDIKRILKKVGEKEGVKITKSGVETMVHRADGDLRKMLNNLQSASMIYDKLDEKKINRCFGYPDAEQMNKIFDGLLNSSFSECYSMIESTVVEDGMCLSDIITELFKILKQCILESDRKYRYTPETASGIISKLRSIEVNLSVNSSDSIQIAGVIGCFKLS